LGETEVEEAGEAVRELVVGVLAGEEVGVNLRGLEERDMDTGRARFAGEALLVRLGGPAFLADSESLINSY